MDQHSDVLECMNFPGCLTYLVVNVAVSEHGVEVLHALAGTAVEIVFEPLLYGAQVHGGFDNLVIVLREEIRTRSSDWYLHTSLKCTNYFIT